MKHRYKTLLLILTILFIATSTVFAQMQRERVKPDEAVSDVFWTPTLITQSTTETLASGNLNVTIMHSFGIATQRPLQTFFGIDNVQNVRLGLDYGISDRWSIGIGRSSLTNVYDLRSKVALLRQTPSLPINLSIKGDVGLVTQENGQPANDDLNTFISLIASRKFNDSFSLQIAPMYGSFSNITFIDGDEVFGVGIGTEIRLSRRFAFTAEYYPVFGERPTGTKNTFSTGLNIETGGHVFQLFFTSTNWHLEQFVMADNRDQFWAGDFRFGFNINRIFGL